MSGPRYSTRKCMGKVLIVQNQKYVDSMRAGEEEDKNVGELRATLMKMGFTCMEVYKNQTKSQMIQLLNDVAARTDLKDDYCFICMVLSYGQDGVIICCDETQSPKEPKPSMLLPVPELQECLKGDKCRDLLLKPKIFMLQLEEVSAHKKQGAGSDIQTEKPMKIPREADFLIYTCVKEHALTIWIEGFKQYVLEPEQPLEIQILLTRMNHLYCKYYSDQKMTVDTPCLTSLLTREAYLKKEEPKPK